MHHFCAGFRCLALLVLLTGCSTVPTRPVDPLEGPRQALREAPRQNSAAAYLDVARAALPLATASHTSVSVRAEATALYNRAVAKAVVALQNGKSGAPYVIRFTPPHGVTHFLVAEDIPRKHLKADIRRPGYGGSLVGIMDGPDTASPNRPPKGYSIPYTAIAEFAGNGSPAVTLHLLDPRIQDQVRLAGTARPLAGDFSASFAYYPHPNEMLFGIVAMLRSDLTVQRSGLLFYQPYDPAKTPVLFVHGLMSSPHAWLQVVNQLEADPAFRRRYQVWSYFYPTGAPIVGNALVFREALAAATARHHLRDNLVVVGHSMGGILTRMQVTNPGRALWNAVFGAKANQIYAEQPANALAKRALLFRANPHISRVVFFSVPHRGSRLATLRAAGFASTLIRMPVTLVKDFSQHTLSLLQQIDPKIRRIPTSIQGLSPDNRLLRALADLPLTVPSDTIVGDRGKPGPLAESSDGVVPYWSSHLPSSESELVVPTGHDSFNHPSAVQRLDEILLTKAPR